MLVRVRVCSRVRVLRAYDDKQGESVRNGVSLSDCANLCACVLMEKPMSRDEKIKEKKRNCVYLCVNKVKCLHSTDLIQCDYLNTAKTRGRR